jgi:YbbR domain-containing protein
MGAAPLVERVSKIQATVSLANAGASLQETRPIRALDQEGREVTGLSLEPAQVQVTVPIRQRSNARDVGVRAISGAPPPAGYWLSRLSVTPASVTLQGNPEQLAQINGFVDTVPIDLGQAFGDLEVQAPLDLPTDIQALDSNTGNVVRTVIVQAQIKARSGDMVTTRPVELLGVTSGVTITISPPEVDLLLSGPLPTLNQIETTSDLIRVGVDVSDLTPGESVNLTPNVFAPDGVKAQLMPPSVLVTISPSPYAWQNK